MAIAFRRVMRACKSEIEHAEEIKLVCPFCKKKIVGVCTYANIPALATPDKKSPDGFSVDLDTRNGDYEASVYCPECGREFPEGDLGEALKMCGYEVD